MTYLEKKYPCFISSLCGKIVCLSEKWRVGTGKNTGEFFKKFPKRLKPQNNVYEEKDLFQALAKRGLKKKLKI